MGFEKKYLASYVILLLNLTEKCLYKTISIIKIYDFNINLNKFLIIIWSVTKGKNIYI